MGTPLSARKRNLPLLQGGIPQCLEDRQILVFLVFGNQGLGVELDPDNKCRAFKLDRLDHAIRRDGGDLQPLARFFNRLVMPGVDPEILCLVRTIEMGIAVDDLSGMIGESLPLRIAVGNIGNNLGWDILIERPAEHGIQHRMPDLLPQLVLQALWQEVWHSPQPPVLTLFSMLRVFRV